MKSELPPPWDHLFEVPPARFVEERNRLVRELVRAKKAAESAEAKALTRPSPSVFGVNQAIRRAPAHARALLEATEALRRAQASSALDARPAYQAALEVQRANVDRLTEVAAKALSEAGINPTEAVLDRVGNDLRWAPLTAESRERLAAGRLLTDMAAPGFEVLAGLAEPAPRARGGAPGSNDAGSRSKDAAAARAAREARARVDALRAELAEAKKAETQARTGAKAAQGRSGDATAKLAELLKQVHAAEREAETARVAREAAERTLAARSAEVRRLEAALGK
jgi:hypothetical protein